jgi:small subunit ribosomal protein S12
MATTFLRNLVLRPALRQQPLALPKPATIARAFSTTPAQSATLMQVLRVRYLHSRSSHLSSARHF